MSLHNNMISFAERERVIQDMIRDAHRDVKLGKSYGRERLGVLKSMLAELRARCDPRPSRTRDDIERCLGEVLRAPRQINTEYDTPRLIRLAHSVIQHWPAIRQALENACEQRTGP